jgi:hypothetical protein
MILPEDNAEEIRQETIRFSKTPVNPEAIELVPNEEPFDP